MSGKQVASEWVEGEGGIKGPVGPVRGTEDGSVRGPAGSRELLKCPEGGGGWDKLRCK